MFTGVVFVFAGISLGKGQIVISSLSQGPGTPQLLCQGKHKRLHIPVTEGVLEGPVQLFIQRHFCF